MNIFINQVVGYGSIAGGLMPDTLQTLIDDNPDSNIYHLTCSNSFKTCYVNPLSRPEVCYKCKLGVSRSLNMINGTFINLKINDIVNESDIIVANNFLKSNSTIHKDLKFEDYKVGESSISTYISHSRDRDLIHINEYNQIRELVENGVILYQALDRFFMEKQIDIVYNFNGRHTYHKAAMDLAQKHKIDCLNMEIARPGGHIEIFKNTLPHNIDNFTKIIEDTWKSADLNLSKKTEIGRNYFKAKIKGVKLNDKVYTQNQVSNKLLDGVDYEKPTIVLYTSSDDEFAAVGEEYDNPYFEDQNEGIFYVSQLMSTKFKDWNLIIRMHPNLVGITHSYVQKLRNLEGRYSNVYIAFPESSVDTYALLNFANKVIVFGSTIGVEANFWGKPVILLGKAFYYNMDLAYIPSSKEEIEYLLREPLLPKNQLNSLKLGYYYSKGGIKSRYFKNGNKKSYFKGVQIYEFSWFDLKKAKLIQLVNRYLGLRLFVH